MEGIEGKQEESPKTGLTFRRRPAIILESSKFMNPQNKRIQELEDALNEIVSRSRLLIHQNMGRWDMTVEHDRRAYWVVETNIGIARDVLGDRMESGLSAAEQKEFGDYRTPEEARH